MYLDSRVLCSWFDSHFARISARDFNLTGLAFPKFRNSQGCSLQVAWFLEASSSPCANSL